MKKLKDRQIEIVSSLTQEELAKMKVKKNKSSNKDYIPGINLLEYLPDLIGKTIILRNYPKEELSENLIKNGK